MEESHAGNALNEGSTERGCTAGEGVGSAAGIPPAVDRARNAGEPDGGIEDEQAGRSEPAPETAGGTGSGVALNQVGAGRGEDRARPAKKIALG